MRQLDKAKIKYEVLEYEIPKEKFSGVKVSDYLGQDYKMCYKTLALKNNHDLFICVIPVDKELDLKKSAKEIGVKSLEMLHVKDLLKEVGYERGSVSPIGVKKNKGIFFDKEVNNHEVIEVSGGHFGISLKVNRDELLKYLNAGVKDLCKDEI
ncbi:MAG: YbaK/EbsC family protein [Erysipelotrichaceae bacterium]|nr:YbaK/EbsC family protein [Erysipelotrichaceae bacterium]